MEEVYLKGYDDYIRYLYKMQKYVEEDLEEQKDEEVQKVERLSKA